MILSNLADNEKVLIQVRDVVASMGFSYAVFDEQFGINILFWNEEQKPTLILCIGIDRLIVRDRLLAGNVYYDADNPKPRYAYYGESGFGSLTKNWSNQELQAKVESLIDHFNRLAAESDCREQFLFDAPKNVIEDMAHAAHVLNSDIYA